MIDIHTHLLPGVDDGSKDLQTSLELINELVNQGVTDIFVTPHFYSLRGFYHSYEKNLLIFEELKEVVKRENMDVNLYLGNEIFYNHQTIKYLKEGVITTLNESKYVLIEFSFIDENESMMDAIKDLKDIGYIPIIAHPERYSYFKELEEYKRLKESGAMFQINASSIVGDYGRKIKHFVKTLINEGLVDFVSSDIHDFRRPNLSKAYEVIEREFSKDKAEQLFNNRVILN